MRAFSCRGWPGMWNAQLRGSGLKPNAERVPREAIFNLGREKRAIRVKLA